MSLDKRISLSVDDRKLQELKLETEKMGRDMIQSSRRLSSSSKEVLRDIEDQIRAIEKRNKLEFDFEKQRLDRAKASGSVSGDQYQSLRQANVLGAKEGSLQVSLLRELIDTIKQQAKDEIRENRKAVEDRIKGSDRVESLRPRGAAEDILRETVQYGMIGDLSGSEREQRTSFKDRTQRFGSRVNQTATMAAGASNEFYLAAAVLGLMPLVGQGASALANRVIGGAGQYEKGLKSYAQTRRGLSQSDAMTTVEGLGDASYFAKFGMNYSDVAQNLGKYRGITANKAGNGTIMNMLAAERVLGIDGGQMGDLASILRYSNDKTGYTRQVKVGEEDVLSSTQMKFGISSNKSAMEKRDVYGSRTSYATSGIMEAISIFDRSSKGNTAIMKEMLGTFQQTSHQILSISGGIDMKQTAANISGISKATGTEGLQLGRVVQGIQGIGASDNPVVKSMMLRSLRQKNPNASYFDVQAMLENPLGGQSFGATEEMFKSLKQMTGGGDLYKQALYSTFGGTLSRTDINEVLKGGGDFTDIAKQAQKAEKGGAIDYKSGLPDVMGKLEESTAKIDSYAQTLGKQSVEFLDKTLDRFQTSIEDIFGTKQEQRQNTKSAVVDAISEVLRTNPGLISGSRF